MNQTLSLLLSLGALSSSHVNAQTYSRYKMPKFPTTAFTSPVVIKSHGLDEEKVGPSTYTWTVLENGCREVSLTLPVACREVDDGAYGALYCDITEGQPGTYTTVSDSCAPKALGLESVQGFATLDLACSYTSIYDLLGTFWPEGQIEKVDYQSLTPSKLKDRVAAYLSSAEEQQIFEAWLAAQKKSDLRMRAKVVRNNVWGGQGADEWIAFCSKNEAVTYVLTRNLWSE